MRSCWSRGMRRSCSPPKGGRLSGGFGSRPWRGGHEMARGRGGQHMGSMGQRLAGPGQPCYWPILAPGPESRERKCREKGRKCACVCVCFLGGGISGPGPGPAPGRAKMGQAGPDTAGVGWGGPMWAIVGPGPSRALRGQAIVVRIQPQASHGLPPKKNSRGGAAEPSPQWCWPSFGCAPELIARKGCSSMNQIGESVRNALWADKDHQPRTVWARRLPGAGPG